MRPEPGLRWLVAGSGIAMLLLGLVVVAAMSATPASRALIAMAWLMVACRQLWLLVRCYATVRRIRVYADGSAEVADAAGCWHYAELQPGSVVLDRVAWLRFDAGGGRQGAELLTGNCHKNKGWRRLQMIWRHLGSAA